MIEQKLPIDDVTNKIVSPEFENFFNEILIEHYKKIDEQNIVGGKLTPSINTIREYALTAGLKIFFGEENVETIKKNQKIIDVIFYGHKFSIKHADCTSSSVPRIVVKWGDNDIQEFIENYSPGYPMILIAYKYGKDGSLFYIIPPKVQIEIFETITKDKFFKVGGRGVQIKDEAVKLLLNHPETKSFDVTWFEKNKNNPDSGIDYHKKELREIMNKKNYSLPTSRSSNQVVENIKIQNRIGRKKCDFKVDLNGKIFYNPSSAKTTYQEVLHSIIDTIGYDELLKNFPNFLAPTKDKLSIKRQKDQYEYRGVCFSTHLSNVQKVKNINEVFKKFPFTFSGYATTQEL